MDRSTTVRVAAAGVGGLAVGIAGTCCALLRRRARPGRPSGGRQAAGAAAGAKDSCPAPEEVSPIAASSDAVLALLKRYKPAVVEGMDPSLHYLAPHVPKAAWTALGDLVAAREKGAAGEVDGSRWISLRLDGCGFSRAVKMMRSRGILEQGFSARFAECMQSCLKGLMMHFNAKLGYTQSDELIVFIAPTNVVRGERQAHARNGRVTKIVTLAASYVTAQFLIQLSQMCQSSGIELGSLAEVLPHFDCRLGHYASWEEARALLLWRAYDCSVNGVSDAVYHTHGSGKQVPGLGKREKVEWLWRRGLLPLPEHQAYGTTLVRVKRVVGGYNPKLGTAVQTLRSVIERVGGPVLELARTESLFPKDDEAEPTPR